MKTNATATWYTVRVGDLVRSFDFPRHTRDLKGPKANFVEGTVEAIGKPPTCSCDKHYHIRVSRVVVQGVDEAVPTVDGKPILVYPPVNGTPDLFGPNDGVEVISKRPPSVRAEEDGEKWHSCSHFPHLPCEACEAEEPA